MSKKKKPTFPKPPPNPMTTVTSLTLFAKNKKPQFTEIREHSFKILRACSSLADKVEKEFLKDPLLHNKYMKSARGTGDAIEAWHREPNRLSYFFDDPSFKITIPNKQDTPGLGDYSISLNKHTYHVNVKAKLIRANGTLTECTVGSVDNITTFLQDHNSHIFVEIIPYSKENDRVVWGGTFMLPIDYIKPKLFRIKRAGNGQLSFTASSVARLKQICENINNNQTNPTVRRENWLKAINKKWIKFSRESRLKDEANERKAEHNIRTLEMEAEHHTMMELEEARKGGSLEGGGIKKGS